MLTNDELADAIKAAVLAVSLVSPFDLAGKEAAIKHMEALQGIQRDRALVGAPRKVPMRVPVGFVSFLPGSNGIDPTILRADRGEWDRLKADPRCIREGVPVYLTEPPVNTDMRVAERVVWGVVANAGRCSHERKQRWAHVVDATGQGSTVSIELCRRAGFDPDETVGQMTGGDDAQS